MDKSASLIWRGVRVCFLIVVIRLLSGCDGRPPPVTPPKYEPEAMAKRAMDQLDKNRDGKLDAGELEHCPALKSALKELDKNKRGYVTEEDIANRLRAFEEEKAGRVAVRCRVTRDGQGVPGVTVTLVPEAFMGDAIKPVSGVSVEEGYVRLRMSEDKPPGAQLGFYRVQASLKDAAGKETLPSRFNTSTTMGQEVSMYFRDEISVRLP